VPVVRKALGGALPTKRSAAVSPVLAGMTRVRAAKPALFVRNVVTPVILKKNPQPQAHRKSEASGLIIATGLSAADLERLGKMGFRPAARPGTRGVVRLRVPRGMSSLQARRLAVRVTGQPTIDLDHYY